MTDKTAVAAPDPKPGTPEYDAKMIAVARSARGEGETTETTAQVEKPARPEHVPEKFWNAETGQVDVENLLKSYSELEKGASKADPPDPTKIPPKEDTADKTAEKAVENAGLNWDDLRDKVVEKGEIDEDDYKALEKSGVPKQIAQEYIQLVKDKADSERKAAVEYIGGPQATTDLMSWASKNLTAAEIDAYNDILAGPGWKAGVDALKARRGDASKTAKEPALTSGVAAGTTGVVGYKDKEEMKADIANPLYTKTTPDGVAFRKQVEEKVRRAAWRNS